MRVEALAAVVLATLAAVGCTGGCSRGKALVGSAVGFEGVVEEDTTGIHPEHLSYTSKGVRSRMDHPGHVRIWNGETKLTYGLDVTAKTYTVQPYDFEKHGDGGPSAWAPTGRTDVIAGHTCQVLETSPRPPGKTHEEACLADDIHVLGFNGGPLTGLSGLRMRLVLFDASGAERERTEVTRVEAKTIDDSVFEVPPGYTNVTKP
jgi:hypothetical protein